VPALGRLENPVGMGFLGLLPAGCALFASGTMGCCLSSSLHLAIELPPFLLRPPQLLDCGRQIEEVNRNDRRSRTKISISD
jgi:hypothetical protein